MNPEPNMLFPAPSDPQFQNSYPQNGGSQIQLQPNNLEVGPSESSPSMPGHNSLGLLAPDNFPLINLNRRKVRRKTVKFEVQEFLPPFLIGINTYHPQRIVRLGQRYQAEIPSYSIRYNKTVGHLKIWSRDKIFDEEVFTEFKKQFGVMRSEDELIELLVKLKSDWRLMVRQFQAHKEYLKKYYAAKDKVILKGAE